MVYCSINFKILNFLLNFLNFLLNFLLNLQLLKLATQLKNYVIITYCFVIFWLQTNVTKK